MKVDLTHVMDHDLADVLPRVSPIQWAIDGYTRPIGDHYKLCSYLADQLRGATILDCATGLGNSAIAFAAHAKARNNYIITVDVADRLRFPMHGLPIEKHLSDCNCHLIRSAVRNVSLILLDISHNGRDEGIFYRMLCESGFCGLMIVDDIRGRQLKSFWESISQQKYDLTEYCHWNGTGLVDFSGELEVVFPEPGA